jgi:hypothetical protein
MISSNNNKQVETVENRRHTYLNITKNNANETILNVGPEVENPVKLSRYQERSVFFNTFGKLSERYHHPANIYFVQRYVAADPAWLLWGRPRSATTLRRLSASPELVSGSAATRNLSSLRFYLIPR